MLNIKCLVVMREDKRVSQECVPAGIFVAVSVLLEETVPACVCRKVSGHQVGSVSELNLTPDCQEFLVPN